MPLHMYKKDNEKANKISKPRYTVAVAAGKGGVGKSTVAVNLALALKKLGLKVGLMDIDVYGPSVRKMLPEQRPPRQQGEKIVPAEAAGIQVMSMAYFRGEGEASVVRAPIANGIVTQFIQNVLWSDLDVLIIDFPPGTGDVQLTLCQKASLTGAVMVTTPQEIAVIDVKKAMHMFEQVNIPIAGVVENMCGYRLEKTGEILYLFGKGGGQRLAKEKGVPFLGEIPIDPEMCWKMDRGLSLYDSGRGEPCPAAAAFEALAKRLYGDLENLQNQQNPCTIADFSQKNAQTFTIRWNDGFVRDYRLSDLQKQCPCAKCVDEATGARISDPGRVDPNVGAKRIEGVGRYALRIDFTSGCSTGIYTFDMLREMAE